MKSLTGSRAAKAAALSLVLSVGLAAGCGGDSDGGGPQDKFIGLWLSEAETTGFTMSCTDTRLTTVFPMAGAKFEIFGNLKFEHGELTDLAETSGNCNLLNYDINGDTATVVDPDPYYADLDPPDNAAGCVVQFGIPTTTNTVLSAAALIAPGASWSAKLLAEKTAGGGDRLELSGTATATIFVADGSAEGILSDPPCSYGGSDTFSRLTRP